MVFPQPSLTDHRGLGQFGRQSVCDAYLVSECANGFIERGLPRTNVLAQLSLICLSFCFSHFLSLMLSVLSIRSNMKVKPAKTQHTSPEDEN